jgi:ATP-binding cassette subfamily B protein
VLVKGPAHRPADEATNAVDSATKQQIQMAFHHLSAGRTTFVVVHRLYTIMEANFVVN